jgi:hypothetical protein
MPSWPTPVTWGRRPRARRTPFTLSPPTVPVSPLSYSSLPRRAVVIGSGHPMYLRRWLSLLSLPPSSVSLAHSTLPALVSDPPPLLPPVQREHGRQRGSSLPPSSVVELPRSAMASACLLWSSLRPSYVRTHSVAARDATGVAGLADPGLALST